MQYLVHFPWIEEQVAAAVLGNEEAEAVRMPLHDAGDEIQLGCHAELALAVGHELAVALHCLDAARKCFARPPVDVHRAHEIGERQRDAGVLQGIEDRGARRQQGRIDIASGAMGGGRALDLSGGATALAERIARSRLRLARRFGLGGASGLGRARFL